MKSFWVFDGSAPQHSGAFEKWWDEQWQFLESLPPSELINQKNCSRFLRHWYAINIRKFPPLIDNKFNVTNLFKKRALYIFSRNLIYIEVPKMIQSNEMISFIPSTGINFMWGHPDNKCYKQFETLKHKLII